MGFEFERNDADGPTLTDKQKASTRVVVIEEGRMGRDIVRTDIPVRSEGVSGIEDADLALK